MTPSPVTVVYTQDAELVRRARAYLRTMGQLRHVSDPDRLDPVLQQTGPSVAIVDLRAKDSRELIAQIQNEHPDVLLIALGVAQSETLTEAEQFGIYAAEELGLDRRRFQSLLGRAFDYVRVSEENRDLRETSTMTREPKIEREPIAESGEMNRAFPLMRFPRVLRRLDNIDALVATLVEALADAAGVSRVGLFSRSRKEEPYRLRAGIHCLPETDQLEFNERDPLVRWFELHAHLVSRGNAARTEDERQRAIMRRALDLFGAEAIVPLFARGFILGWIFFGNRVTGRPFEDRDLEGLTTLAEHVSTIFENALLYEEATVQKSLAETLLKSIPPGIVAIDENANVRWFNPPAEKILGVSSTEILNKPVERVGNRLAGLLRETLESKVPPSPERWIDSNTRRSLSIETRQLSNNGSALGAVAVIQDVTTQESLREKQALLDRATFWTDLAASMSHEIRNPLVAIKTFAQLLPERFDDADFRREFNEIVVNEVDRLDKIITQINNFAHPPELVLKPIDVRAPVKKGVEIAKSRYGINGKIELETSLPGNLPRVMGDEAALAEAFAHLLANAAEASADRTHPRITLTAKPVRRGKEQEAVVVTVRDNGSGIAPELKDKIFSPFCTTKPRGMGLGLPIVKRTVFEHQGRVEVDSSSKGTEVSVLLPARSNGD
ncbi:MAG TPA: ATP-binding protein [Chthoniobacterales bacterium]|jgi:PAS domain S-box-containing protein|nr:ATP-binding protein [Chthoniobacterales bacterium]